MASAGLLILLGIVLQLAELGYGHVNAGNMWLYSVVVTDVWHALSVHLNVTAVEEWLKFWPLLLVCVGLAIFLALKPADGSAERSAPRA